MEFRNCVDKLFKENQPSIFCKLTINGVWKWGKLFIRPVTVDVDELEDWMSKHGFKLHLLTDGAWGMGA